MNIEYLKTPVQILCFVNYGMSTHYRYTILIDFLGLQNKQ